MQYLQTPSQKHILIHARLAKSLFTLSLWNGWCIQASSFSSFSSSFLCSFFSDNFHLRLCHYVNKPSRDFEVKKLISRKRGNWTDSIKEKKMAGNIKTTKFITLKPLISSSKYWNRFFITLLIHDTDYNISAKIGW